MRVVAGLGLQLDRVKPSLSGQAPHSPAAVFAPEIELQFSLEETPIDSLAAGGEYGCRELCALLARLQERGDAAGCAEIWQAWLLLVPQIIIRERRGVVRPLGLMFSDERLGCAVALEAIEVVTEKCGGCYDRLLLHTIAHELGHVFNLGHDYQRSTVMTPTHVLRSHSSFPHNLRFGIAPGHRRWLGSGAEQLVRPGGSRYRGSWAASG